MKFTLAWLKEHLETSASLDEITDTLTRQEFADLARFLTELGSPLMTPLADRDSFVLSRDSTC